MRKTETTLPKRICCPCGSKLMNKSGVSDAQLGICGWERVGKQWYCDNCIGGSMNKKIIKHLKEQANVRTA